MTLVELQREIDNSLFSPDCWLKSQILYREDKREKISLIQQAYKNGFYNDGHHTGQGAQEQSVVGGRNGGAGQRSVSFNSKAPYLHPGTVKRFTE